MKICILLEFLRQTSCLILVFFFKPHENVRLWSLAIQCPKLQMKADFHPDTLKWNVHMCLMLLLFYSCITSTWWISFDAIPNNLQFEQNPKPLHSQRVQVPRTNGRDLPGPTCQPQVTYLWAVLIVLTDASGGNTLC